MISDDADYQSYPYMAVRQSTTTLDVEIYIVGSEKVF